MTQPNSIAHHRRGNREPGASSGFSSRLLIKSFSLQDINIWLWGLIPRASYDTLLSCSSASHPHVASKIPAKQLTNSVIASQPKINMWNGCQQASSLKSMCIFIVNPARSCHLWPCTNLLYLNELGVKTCYFSVATVLSWLEWIQLFDLHVR